MSGKCKVCGYQAGIFNLKDGRCKSCLDKDVEIHNKTDQFQHASVNTASKNILLFSFLIALIFFICLYFFYNSGQQQGKRAYNNKDYATAFNLFQQGAKQGHAEAQYYLGNMYRYGHNVVKNLSITLKWYQKSAEQGHVEAQSALGYLYYRKKDYNNAKKWLEKAAEEDDVYALYNLGSIYEHGFGFGFMRDYDLAVKWYKKAAEQGSKRAHNKAVLICALLIKKPSNNCN